MKRHHKLAARSLLLLLTTSLFGCGIFGSSGLGAKACPAMRANVDALANSYSANAQVDAKVAAFVQASKDMAQVSVQLEEQVTAACLRMGADLGIPPQQMQPVRNPGGKAEGACRAVAARIDMIMRQGIRFHVAVQPPVCTANASAQARCGGRCDVNSDAECRASCKAHAEAHASCTPAQVTIQASQGAHMAGQLMATLQANLPALIHAQIALGQRLAADAKVVAQVGSNLPRLIGNAGAQALACIGAAADAAASASFRINVSVQASASVSGRVGS